MRFFTVLLLNVLCVFNLAHSESFLSIDTAGNEICFDEEQILDLPAPPKAAFDIPLFLMAIDYSLEEMGDILDTPMPFAPCQSTPLDAYLSPSLWYTTLVSSLLGEDVVLDYLSKFSYGNQRILKETPFYWKDGTLLITPRETVHFILAMKQFALPITPLAPILVKELFFIEQLPSGARLYGRAILEHNPNGASTISSFVGWLETEIETRAFFYCQNGNEQTPKETIERLHQLLGETS